MLTFQSAEDASPTNTYADACWRDDPRISPDYWRELLGHTVGKLALDWRTSVAAERALALGTNLVLTAPATHARAAEAIAAQLNPIQAAVTICFTTTPAVLPQPAPTYVVWQIENAPTEEEAIAAFTTLETLTAQGAIAGYGLADSGQSETQPAIALHQWLAWAEAAAQSAHGRRKRPALQVLAVEMDLLKLNALTPPVTQHKGENVSALEFAARLGWAVIALPLALPDSGTPSPQALQAFVHTAQVEHQLNQQLNGWPMMNGQPLFNVLQHLGQGTTPWLTPHHWQAWRRHVWPTIRQHWQQLQMGLPDALCQAIVNYCHQLEALQQYGPALSEAAAQQAVSRVLAEISPHFPVTWRMARPRSQVLGLLASLPAVTAVAAAPEVALNSLNDLQTQADFPDVGAILPLQTA